MAHELIGKILGGKYMIIGNDEFGKGAFGTIFMGNLPFKSLVLTLNSH